MRKLPMKNWITRRQAKFQRGTIVENNKRTTRSIYVNPCSTSVENDHKTSATARSSPWYSCMSIEEITVNVSIAEILTVVAFLVAFFVDNVAALTTDSKEW
jgi:hypothetical protein|tara:strand:- start:757 stop:1059 length:303 start_codon:yes stop_codon:yes gene_type:complete